MYFSIGYEYKTVLKPGIGAIHVAHPLPHHKTSFDLLNIWRTYFEPWKEFDNDDEDSFEYNFFCLFIHS